MKITLSPLTEKDVVELALIANNKNIASRLRTGFPYPYTRADAIAFIKSCKEEKTNLINGIYYQKKLAGVIGLTMKAKNKAEIGYWIGEPYWGMGVATAATQAIITKAFNEAKLALLYAHVMENNIASQRVLEKAGFKKIRLIDDHCNEDFPEEKTWYYEYANDLI